MTVRGVIENGVVRPLEPIDGRDGQTVDISFVDEAREGLLPEAEEIADRLVLSERTIDNHVQNIMNKLNLHHRAQIASWVTERTRVPPTPKP